MLKAAAEMHKKTFYAQVSEVGVLVTVRQPKDRETASNNLQKVYGPSGAETETDESLDKVIKVIWSADPTGFSGIDDAAFNRRTGALALNPNAFDVIIRCRMEDVMYEGASKNAPTQIDTAFDVVYDGYSWKVKQTLSTGLPPLGPYVLWAGLSRNGEV